MKRIVLFENELLEYSIRNRDKSGLLNTVSDEILKTAWNRAGDKIKDKINDSLAKVLREEEFADCVLVKDPVTCSPESGFGTLLRKAVREGSTVSILLYDCDAGVIPGILSIVGVLIAILLSSVALPLSLFSLVYSQCKALRRLQREKGEGDLIEAYEKLVSYMAEAVNRRSPENEWYPTTRELHDKGEWHKGLDRLHSSLLGLMEKKIIGTVEKPELITFGPDTCHWNVLA